MGTTGRFLILISLALIGFGLTCHAEESPGDGAGKGKAKDGVSQGDTITLGSDAVGPTVGTDISPDSKGQARQNRPGTDESTAASSTTGRLRNSQMGVWVKKFVIRPARKLLKGMIFTFPFWAALLLTLTLERLIPAEPNRKIFSISFAHDLMWFVYEPFLHALIVGTYVALLANVYGSYFSYLTFSGLTAAPEWTRFVVALLLVDLGYWVQHYINHKVPFLWKLHSLHHSQRQLNFFTDFRYHPLEYIVRHTFISVPFLFLKVNPPAIVAFAVIMKWYSRFYHGNIRTNLGPLKYILVTPQSHRIHHSLEAQHRDLNFGSIFSFWDFLFRKQYQGFDEYPATGIDDESFPHEQKLSLKSLFLTPWLQMRNGLSRRQGTVPR